MEAFGFFTCSGDTRRVDMKGAITNSGNVPPMGWNQVTQSTWLHGSKGTAGRLAVRHMG